jgi:hypothetical protein
MRWITALLLLQIVLTTTTARAQNTDVGAKVASSLQEYGPVPVTKPVAIPKKESYCNGGSHGGSGSCYDRIVYISSTQTTNEILTASNFRVTASTEVVFDAPIRTELPDKVHVTTSTVQNCSKNTVSQNISLQQAFQRNVSVQISHSVMNSVTTTLGVQLKIGDAFTASGQVAIGRSETNGEAKTAGSQDTTTRTVTGTITVPGLSTSVAELSVWPVHFVFPFHATVTVDADLSPKNDRGLTALSQILDVNARTYDITGTLVADDASDGKLMFYDLTFDSSTCHGVKGVAVNSQAVLEENTKLFEHAEPQTQAVSLKSDKKTKIANKQ